MFGIENVKSHMVTLQGQLDAAMSELAAWRELYDYVTIKFEVGIFPERYEDLGVRAVAERLKELATVEEQSSVQIPSGDDRAPRFSSLSSHHTGENHE